MDSIERSRPRTGVAVLMALLLPVSIALALQAGPAPGAPSGKNAQDKKAQTEGTQDPGAGKVGPVKAEPGKPTRVDRSFRPIPDRKTPISKPTVVLKPGEEPKIRFENVVHTFGRLRAGQDVVHDFRYTNTGSGPLEILRVKPSCGCTTAGTYDRIVQPGEEGRIPIKLDTTRYSGVLKKTITVNTNCRGPGARVVLQLVGEVWQAFELTPRKASFGRVSVDDLESRPAVRKVTIVNNLEAPARPGPPRSSNPCFVPELKTLESGRKYELEIRLAQPLRSASNSGTIEFDPGIEGEGPVKVPVSVYVTSAVDVMPSQLTLPAGRDREWRRTFIIRNNGKEAIRVFEPQVSTPKIQATLTPVRAGREFRLNVRVSRTYEVPPGGDTITVKTSHPKAPTLTIPVLRRQSAAPGGGGVISAVRRGKTEGAGKKAIEKKKEPAAGPGPVKPG